MDKRYFFSGTRSKGAIQVLFSGVDVAKLQGWFDGPKQVFIGFSSAVRTSE